MAKQRLKTPRELGYNAGLSGETVESHIYVAEFNEADREEWEAGRKAGAIRKAEHDAEDDRGRRVRGRPSRRALARRFPDSRQNDGRPGP